MTAAVTSNPTVRAGLTVQTRPIADLRPHPRAARGAMAIGKASAAVWDCTLPEDQWLKAT
jgi:hypothetical protein